MSKKTNYIHDMQDVFDSSADAQELLSVAETIKQAQKKAFPSGEYKAALFSRLESIHLIDQEQEEHSSFSIFQIFGALCSFFFIAGGVFLVLDMRQDSGEYLRDASVPEYEATHEILLDNAETIVPVPTTRVLKSSSNVSDAPSNEPTKQAETEPSVMPQSVRAQPNSQEDTPEQDSPVQDSPAQDSPSTEPQNTPPAEPMMDSQVRMGTFSTMPPQEDEQNFEETCNGYGGELSEDGMYCVFSDAHQCTQEDIHECAMKDGQ